MNKELNVRVINGEDIGNPEVAAMLQAFYSRSPMSIDERLKYLSDGEPTLNEAKVKAALKRYYFDYGHASIADCGFSTVYIENVSMLAAKVFQDDPLYNGQECSTRYLNFSKQQFLGGGEHPEQEQLILETWRQLYTEALPLLVEWAKAKYSPEYLVSSKIPEDKVQETWEKSCTAIAFDVARGLLPCGATTSLAWTGSLRRMRERLEQLAYHPLEEVRDTAAVVYRRMQERHPNSFSECGLDLADGLVDPEHFYETTGQIVLHRGPCVNEVHRIVGARDLPRLLAQSLNAPKNLRERVIDNAMYFSIEGGLDFGSFRDIQRHRRGLNRLPIVGEQNSCVTLHSYYINILQDVAPKVMTRVRDIFARVMTEFKDPIARQYLMPMMTVVAVTQYWSLGQLRYVLNLRSKTTVHPTLREWSHALYNGVIAHAVNDESCSVIMPYLKVDRRGHYETADRGNQTLKERQV